MSETEPVHRALLAVDVESSGSRDSEAFVIFRRVLFESVRNAFEASRIDWARCVRDDRGDGVIVIVPTEFPKPRLIYPLLDDLAARLRHHNRYAAPVTRIRVRVAIHAGDVRIDDYGVTGQPKVLLARLLESDALKDALAGAPETVTVALIVSDGIHDDVIRQGHPGIEPDGFTPVTVRNKETNVRAWLRVPGHPPLSEPAARPAKQPGETRPGGGVHFNSSTVEVKGDVVGGDKIVRS